MYTGWVNKKSLRLKNHYSLNIKLMILENIPFNSRHVQIDLKIYLTEIGHSVLKLREIFSRMPFREIFKTGSKQRPTLLKLSASSQWVQHILTYSLLFGRWNRPEWCCFAPRNDVFHPPKGIEHAKACTSHCDNA